MKHKHVPYALPFAAIFLAYLALAKLGLNLYDSGQVVSIIWPPAGIALAGILLFGYRMWPAVTAAVFVLNLTQGDKPLTALLLTVGNTVEPLLGAYLLKRFGNFSYSLERIKDVLNLVLFAAIMSTIVGATVGVTSLVFAGVVPCSAFGGIWPNWWVGDLLGILVVTPLLLVWSQQSLKALLKIRIKPVTVVVAVGLLGTTTLAFRGYSAIGIKPFILAYLVFPLLIWVALRFHQLGSVTAALVVSVVAIGGTIANAHGSPSHTNEQLLLLQTFLGVTTITFMIISAGVAELEAHHERQLKLLARTTRLAKQKAKLIALGQAKDDFLAIASHQLTSPPTIIKQYIGMLLGNYEGHLSQGQRDMLTSAYSANEKQLKVIHAFLNVARLDAGNVILHKENVNVGLVIREVLEEKSDVFTVHKQPVTFVPGRGKYMAYVDRVKLSMVLENVVDNAGKYTPDGKGVEITLTKDTRFVTIAVKDNGIGFTKKDARTIFKKYHRIHKNTPTIVEGTGIGLYWAKKIIDLHGGTITAVSKPGKGTTFTISVPIATKPHRQSRSKPVESMARGSETPTA